MYSKEGFRRWGMVGGIILCMPLLSYPDEGADLSDLRPCPVAVAQFTPVDPETPLPADWGDQLAGAVAAELSRGHLQVDVVAGSLYSPAPLSPERKEQVRAVTTAAILMGGRFTVTSDQVHLDLGRIDLHTGEFAPDERLSAPRDQAMEHLAQALAQKLRQEMAASPVSPEAPTETPDAEGAPSEGNVQTGEDRAETLGTETSAEETEESEETPVATVSPEELADVHSDFWKGFGMGLLTFPAPTAPTDDAHLVVARYLLPLRLPDPDADQSHTVTATLTFYEIRNDLQMELDFTEPLSYSYLGVTEPQQIELSIPGTKIDQDQRFPVDRCGLIQVLALNAEESTRLLFIFTPAGSFDPLNQPGTETLYARVYKGEGLPRPPVEVVAEAPAYKVKGSQIGVASWYGSQFHGRKTASGERFNMDSATAAHRTLPIGTKARVTNLQNGKSAVVRINDRGPYSRRRIIDVSRGVADRLGFRRRGVARVRVEVLESAKNKE